MKVFKIITKVKSVKTIQYIVEANSIEEAEMLIIEGNERGEGEEIKAGQELVLIEAMKMENSIRSDHDVKIKKIKFQEGETVGIGQVVIEFENNL